MDPLLTALAALVLCYVFYVKHARSSKYLRLPPSPPSRPLIGHLLDFPKEKPWRKFKEWSHQCQSDILHLNLAGTGMLIINSQKAAVELLDIRGAVYSSRAPSTMAGKLMGWGYTTAFLPYGQTLKDHRRLLNQEFSSQRARRFRPQQAAATKTLLKRLLVTPENWEPHIRYQLSSTLLDVAYGIDVLPENDPYIHKAEEAITTLKFAAVPGKFLVDSFPFLQHVPSWLPGAGFKRAAEAWRRLTFEARDMPWRAMEDSIAQGTAKASFTSYTLQNMDPSRDKGYQETVIKNTAGVIYLAGVDTSLSILSTFVLMMLKHPDIQAKAQRELDTVLGHGQLPDYGDEVSLPYLKAVVKECLRIEPPFPLAIPHMTTSQDVYRGYTIPAQTIVLPNIWAITHDEDIYDNPLVFRPERFLTSDEKSLDSSVLDPSSVMFGYGRRICPGRFLGLETLWLTIGSILATYNIQNAVDQQGNVIDPPGSYSTGFTTDPEPFECKLTPRSQVTEDMVNNL